MGWNLRLVMGVWRRPAVCLGHHQSPLRSCKDSLEVLRIDETHANMLGRVRVRRILWLGVYVYQEGLGKRVSTHSSV